MHLDDVLKKASCKTLNLKILLRLFNSVKTGSTILVLNKMNL